MAGSLVQHRMSSLGAVSSASLAFSSPVTIGNRVIVGVSCFPNTRTISSIADNGTTPNSYSNDVANVSNATIGDTYNIRSAQVATNPGSGNLQVTVTFSGAISGGNIFIQEVSGLDTTASPVDRSGANVNTSAVTSGSVTSSGNTTATGEYSFGIFAFGGNAQNMTGASSTTVDDFDNTNGANSAHKSATAGGTETLNVTWTNTSTYMAGICVYKLVGATVASLLPAVRAARATYLRR